MSVATSHDLVLEHLPMANRLARRYARDRQALEDVRQVAALALVRAAERFDPDRGFAFAAYAYATIVGDIRVHFRSTAWVVHVPRSVQEASLHVRKACEELTQTLQRPPRTEEVAAWMVRDVEYVRAGLDAGRCGRSTDVQRTDVVDRVVGGVVEAVVDRVALADALGALPEGAQVLLALRFTLELTQSEIAELLGHNQMWVSRALRRILEHLRAELGDLVG